MGAMALPRWSAIVVLVCAASVLSGCGSSKDSVDKRLNELRDEITRLQNTQDRLGERLMAVEVQRLKAAPAPAAAAAERTERPPLKVIRLAPNQPDPAAPAEGSQEADEDGARPVLKLRGKEGASARSKREPVAKLSQD